MKKRKVEEKEMELLGVYAIRNRSSYNKILHFKWEPIHTVMYVHKQYNGYVLSKTDVSDTSVQVREATTPKFRYITVKKAIAEDGMFAVFRIDEANYYIRLATQDEQDAFGQKTHVFAESGHVRKKYCGITITKDDQKRLWTSPNVHMHVVMKTSKLFIEAKAVSCDEAKQWQTYSHEVTNHGGQECVQRSKNVVLDYVLPIEPSRMSNGILPIPISFIKRAGASEDDVYPVWFKDDGTFVIEGRPIKCDICGKEISRYYDNANDLCICKDCSQGIDALNDYKKITYKGITQNDFRNIKDNLDKIALQLTELINACN